MLLLSQIFVGTAGVALEYQLPQ